MLGSDARVGRDGPTVAERARSGRAATAPLEVSVEELLGCARWGVVSLMLEAQHFEVIPEGLAERFRSVALHGQAAASFGSIEPECRDDDLPSDRDGIAEVGYVSLPIHGIRQEVEYCPVVP